MKRLPSLLLVSLGFFVSHASDAASFDCAKAATSMEKAICADPEISELDSQLMTAYKDALLRTWDERALKAEQREWITKVRNQSADSESIKAAYKTRIAALVPKPASTPTAKTAASSAPASSDNLAPVQATNAPQEMPLAPAVANPQQAARSPQPVAGAASPASLPTSVAASVPAAASAANASTPAAETAPSPVKPDAGVSGVFNGIYTMLVALFLLGLVKPRWILRWDANASRMKMLAYFLVVGVPIGLLGEFTKSKTTRQYEASVRTEREKQKELLQGNQRAASNNASSNNNVHQVAQQSELQGSEGQQQFSAEMIFAQKLIRQARAMHKDEGPCDEQIDEVEDTANHKVGEILFRYQSQGLYEQGLTLATSTIHIQALQLQNICGL